MVKRARPQGLVLRKHADKTGDRLDDGSWPSAGVSIVDHDRAAADPPQSIILTPGKIAEGVREGWASTEGDTPVVRPAGPTMADWNSSHTGTPHVFIHLDRVVLHTREGDVAYKVTHQPDKYVDSDNPREKVTAEKYAAGNTRVDNFYLLELEG